MAISRWQNITLKIIYYYTFVSQKKIVLHFTQWNHQNNSSWPDKKCNCPIVRGLKRKRRTFFDITPAKCKKSKALERLTNRKRNQGVWRVAAANRDAALRNASTRQLVLFCCVDLKLTTKRQQCKRWFGSPTGCCRRTVIQYRLRSNDSGWNVYPLRLSARTFPTKKSVSVALDSGGSRGGSGLR